MVNMQNLPQNTLPAERTENPLPATPNAPIMDAAEYPQVLRVNKQEAWLIEQVRAIRRQTVLQVYVNGAAVIKMIVRDACDFEMLK